MLFHTVTFIVFFAITVALLIALRQHSTQKNVLLVASMIFYMWWNPAFILLIVYSTVIDYFVALRLDRTEKPSARRGLILISLVTNLGMLAFFKYFGFFEHNLLYAFRAFGYKPNWADLHIILPVGI
ncbi:MAG TPA: MBOAT family protein, partial [Thermoanaerobaculia bacterium]|nr:MBOAT family protein [Thermoanaerobaculia bacterium]